MSKSTIVWSRTEGRQVAAIIEANGGKVTSTRKISDFPPRWEIVYVEKKNE